MRLSTNTMGGLLAELTELWLRPGLVWRGAARFQLNSWFALSPPAEWFDDHEGFATGTGVAQQLKEFTMTAEAKAMQGILARLEYRRDSSDKNFCQKGSGSATGHTVTRGIVAFFGPKK